MLSINASITSVDNLTVGVKFGKSYNQSQFVKKPHRRGQRDGSEPWFADH